MTSHLTSGRHPCTVIVDVKDQGPGIPAVALERGRSDRGSTGLGLDIVGTCAEATGGGLEVRTDGQWSVVRPALGTALDATTAGAPPTAIVRRRTAPT
ncbi:hypothetical protein L1785_19185 [Antribacter sp. KLBMP9083]|uniref:Histidine kinase/HSP90-like ATPase domain-containing protein n=1 Tax=Antribacter soli TaxID=2910976 RepID=A0AA41QGL4_9MICO|nr:ATP-binding protein [Antribacter soli]MCF4123100.1 hypothetical protein [Antribacter soli]